MKLLGKKKKKSLNYYKYMHRQQVKHLKANVSTGTSIQFPNQVCKPQEPQDATMQSWAHASVLQSRDSERIGHAVPVLTTAVVTTREREEDPLPHVWEQELHVDQWSTTQSTEHSLMLHPCDCDKDAGHAVPVDTAGDTHKL